MTHHETVSRCGACTALCGGWLCTRCVHELADKLSAVAIAARESASLLDELNTVLSRTARMSTGKGAKRTKGTEQPLVVDMRAAHAYEQLEALVRRAFLMCGAVSAQHVRGHTRWPSGSRAQAVVAVAHITGVVQHPECVELLHELRASVDEVTRIIDRPPDQWYAGQCSAATERGACTTDLYAREGQAIVRCPACKTEHDVAQRRAVLLRAVEDVLATATEIARAVHLLPAPITRSVIYSYAHRRRIVARGTNSRGEPLYRVGDVLDLVRDQAKRRALSD